MRSTMHCRHAAAAAAAGAGPLRSFQQLVVHPWLRQQQQLPLLLSMGMPRHPRVPRRKVLRAAPLLNGFSDQFLRPEEAASSCMPLLPCHREATVLHALDRTTQPLLLLDSSRSMCAPGVEGREDSGVGPFFGGMLEKRSLLAQGSDLRTPLLPRHREATVLHALDRALDNLCMVVRVE